MRHCLWSSAGEAPGNVPFVATTTTAALAVQNAELGLRGYGVGVSSQEMPVDTCPALAESVRAADSSRAGCAPRTTQ